MMLLRARTLAAGRSGARPILVERIADLLNANITPAVPSRGSVGASGDLAQLAHTALSLLGEGRVLVGENGTEPAGDALARAGLQPHPGQADSAANLRALLEGSGIIASHRDSAHAVQDPYSMRCAPQVHGAARDAAAFAGEVFDRERASTVDNPVVMPDGRVESTGNFHGEPLAYAMDLLAVAITGVAGISERRTYWLLGPAQQRELPPFLAT